MKTARGRLLLLLLLAVGFSAAGFCAYGWQDHAGEFRLTILHTNDIHAHDEPYMEHGRLIGGMARIGYLIKAIKYYNHNVLAVDAGDFFQGTPLFQRYQGEVEVHLLNHAGYDIVALGNHEFDSGPKNLAKQLQLAKFSIISCNLDFTEEPDLASLVKPFVIRIINGEKIAFIGATTAELNRIALNAQPVKVKMVGDQWIPPIADYVEQCRQAGINKIILVTHCGVDADKLLAQSLPDVDLIIGGHSHTRLDEPIWVEHANGSKTMIVQTGSYARTLGKLELDFDPKGELIEPKTNYHLINITERIKEDPEMVAYLNEKMQPLQALRYEIVGYAEGDFESRLNKVMKDSAIGDAICDALSEAGLPYGATISLENRGGIRARIEKGPITEEKIQEMLPFDNHLIIASISGKCLLDVLEHAVGGSTGTSRLDVHGLKFVYDCQKPAGQRIVFASAADKHGDWRPIDPQSVYRVIVNDYNFKGGEGYDFSSAQQVVFLPDLLSATFHKYLAEHKRIAPHSENRIQPVDDRPMKERRTRRSLQETVTK